VLLRAPLRRGSHRARTHPGHSRTRNPRIGAESSGPIWSLLVVNWLDEAAPRGAAGGPSEQPLRLRSTPWTPRWRRIRRRYCGRMPRRGVRAAARHRRTRAGAQPSHLVPPSIQVRCADLRTSLWAAERLWSDCRLLGHGEPGHQRLQGGHAPAESSRSLRSSAMIARWVREGCLRGLSRSDELPPGPDARERFVGGMRLGALPWSFNATWPLAVLELHEVAVRVVTRGRLLRALAPQPGQSPPTPQPICGLR
jgi:hypothetical protein